MLYTADIKIEKIADATRFVQMANTLSNDVVLHKGNLKVDGRSIMGVFSIDPSNGVTVEFNDEDSKADEFMDFLREFLI